MTTPNERLRNMSDEVVTEINKNQLMTALQVAERLQVPIATVHNWRYRSIGPKGFRVGKHLRFDRNEVEAWITEQKANEGESI